MSFIFMSFSIVSWMMLPTEEMMSSTRDTFAFINHTPTSSFPGLMRNVVGSRGGGDGGLSDLKILFISESFVNI